MRKKRWKEKIVKKSKERGEEKQEGVVRSRGNRRRSKTRRGRIER